MSSLAQYIELYRGASSDIDAHSVPALNRRRGEALDTLLQGELARKGHEGYVYTAPADIFGRDYGVNIHRLAFPADIARAFRCDVPNMSTLLGITVNDTFAPSRTLASRLPEGVLFMSLRQAAESHPETVERYYGSVANLTDCTTALNTLLAQDGVLIHIAAGVHLDKPLQLVNLFSAPTSMLAPRRLLVVAEAGSSAQILICDHTQDMTQHYLDAQVAEIILGENARIDMCHIEESSALTSRHADIYVRQHAGSEFHATEATLTCGTTRNNYSIDLAERGSSAHLASMAIASGNQCVDNSVVLRHLAPHTKSRQLFKYVLDDDSRGSFAGRILVSEQAPHTDAYQTNRNILASHDARMHTKPQLEIYTDDVKCSHGATTGQLDNEALFYMRTRGIPETEARHMLMQAFMSDVIDTVEMDGLRDRLRHLVERRFSSWSHDSAGCAGNCHGSCTEILEQQ